MLYAVDRKTSSPQGSDAFQLEYKRPTHTEALRKDIQSYLGEYRFNIDKYEYELEYSAGSDGVLHLRDVDEHESMLDKVSRSIRKREDKNKNTSREKAEFLGVLNLEAHLESALLGDQIVWTSPPGNSDDGYGNYGFVYLGRVDKKNGENKHLSMVAIRVEEPTIEQFIKFVESVTKKPTNYTHAEQFLASPEIAVVADPEQALREIFHFKIDEVRERLFHNTMHRIQPQINEFISLVQSNSDRAVVLQAFEAIEHFVLDIMDEYEKTGQNAWLESSTPHRINLRELVYFYQDKGAPPIVSGSCGSTQGSGDPLTSSNIFNKLSALNEVFSGDKAKDDPNLCRCSAASGAHFHCPGKSETCRHPIVVGSGTSVCPSCGTGRTC